MVVGAVMLIVGISTTKIFNNNSSNSITDNIAPNNNIENTIPQKEYISSGNFEYYSQSTEDESTVKVQTPRGDVTLFVLQGNEFDASGWTKETRAKQIVRKLYRFKQDNRSSNYIKAQVINGYNTICVPQNINSICQEEDILVTLSQDKDPNQILASLMNNDSKILVNEYFTYDNQGNLVVEVEKFVNSELSK